MSDKVREALFAVLTSMGAEPIRVLDLYAGTGAIGIEALSRGADFADFVDHQKAACAVIRDNLGIASLTEQGAVHCMSIDQVLRRLRGPYDLVILDPPYAAPDIEAQLGHLAASSLLQSDALVALGHWPRLELPEQIGRLTLLRRRCHGDSCFSIFAVEASPGTDETTNEARDS
jgi:16S rRNA (guanine966-N2)-methyltransferase